MISEYKYAFSSSRANILRGTLAASVCFFFLVASEPLPIVSYSLVVMGVIFAGYALWCFRRRNVRVAITEGGVEVGDKVRVGILWNDIEDVRLDFYTTRRDRDSGWMTLKLRDKNGKSVRVGSDLDGFQNLVGHVAKVVEDTGLEMNVSTRANIDAVLGRAG